MSHACGLQHGQQSADFDVLLQRVSQMPTWLEPVMILPADAIAFEIAAVFEINNDPLHGTFGDQHLLGDVSNANGRPEKDAMQDVCVIAQERPFWVLQLL